MSRILIIEIKENGDVSVMNDVDVKLKENILDEIADTYKRLNISEKNKHVRNRDYNEIFRYDYTKKSSLAVNSYAKV